MHLTFIPDSSGIYFGQMFLMGHVRNIHPNDSEGQIKCFESMFLNLTNEMKEN